MPNNIIKNNKIYFKEPLFLYSTEHFKKDIFIEKRYILDFLNNKYSHDINKDDYISFLNKQESYHYEAYKTYTIPWLFNFENNIKHTINFKSIFEKTDLENKLIYINNVNVIAFNNDEKREIIKNINKNIIDIFISFVKPSEEVVKYLKNEEDNYFYYHKYTYFHTKKISYTDGSEYIKKNGNLYEGNYHVYVDDRIATGINDKTGPNEELFKADLSFDSKYDGFLGDISNKSEENKDLLDKLMNLNVDNEKINILNIESIKDVLNKINDNIKEESELFIGDLKEVLFDSIPGLEENMEEFEELQDECDECAIITSSKRNKKNRIKKKIKNKKILNKLKFPKIRIPSVPNSHDLLGIKPARHGYPLGF